MNSFVFHTLFFFVFPLSLTAENLLIKRGDFKTKLTKKESNKEELPKPPENEFKIIQYSTNLGDMSAYLSQHPEASQGKRPAIVWLTGGFPESSPGEYLWTQTDVSNEQSARIYRHYGVVTMYPLLRGRVKGNPGVVERFYGEVNDVISAGKYLKTLDYIDPNRIYLGGHSTGGTLALLVAESSDLFAGVISLGPTNDHYGEDNAVYEWKAKEIELRSPDKHLSYIKTPTYIIEGEHGNAYALGVFSKKLNEKPNKNVKVISVKSADHFNVIHPINKLFAEAIMADKSPKLEFKKDLKSVYLSYSKQRRETSDLQILADARSEGILLEGKKVVESIYSALSKKELFPIIEQGKKAGLTISEIEKKKSRDGEVYYTVTLSKKIDVSALKEVFTLSKQFSEMAAKNELYYNYWSISGE